MFAIIQSGGRQVKVAPGDVITVEAVQVENIDSTLQITVQYVTKRSQQRQAARSSRSARRN